MSKCLHRQHNFSTSMGWNSMHLSEEKLHVTAGTIQQLLQQTTIPNHARPSTPSAAMCNRCGKRMLGRYMGLGSGTRETQEEPSTGGGARGSSKVGEGKGRQQLVENEGGGREGHRGEGEGMSDLPLVRAFEASASMLRWLTSMMGRCCFTYPDTKCPACHAHLSGLVPAETAHVGQKAWQHYVARHGTLVGRYQSTAVLTRFLTEQGASFFKG